MNCLANSLHLISIENLWGILKQQDIWCLNIHETHVTAYNSTNNNVLFFVSDLKIVYYNNY